MGRLVDVKNVIRRLERVEEPTLFCGRGCGANVPANVMALYYLYVAKDLDPGDRLALALDQYANDKYVYCLCWHRCCSDGGVNFIEKLYARYPNAEDIPDEWVD